MMNLPISAESLEPPAAAPNVAAAVPSTSAPPTASTSSPSLEETEPPSVVAAEDDDDIPPINIHITETAVIEAVEEKLTELLNKWGRLEELGRQTCETPDPESAEFWKILGHVQGEFREQLKFFLRTYYQSQTDEDRIPRLCTYFQETAKRRFDELLESLRGELPSGDANINVNHINDIGSQNSRERCSGEGSLTVLSNRGSFAEGTLIDETSNYLDAQNLGERSLTVLSNGGTFAEGTLVDETTSNDIDAQNLGERSLTVLSNGGTFAEGTLIDETSNDIDLQYLGEGSLTVLSNGGTFAEGTLIDETSNDIDSQYLGEGSLTVLSNGGTFAEGTLIDETSMNITVEDNESCDVSENSMESLSDVDNLLDGGMDLRTMQSCRVIVYRDQNLDEKAKVLKQLTSSDFKVKCNQSQTIVSETTDSAFESSGGMEITEIHEPTARDARDADNDGSSSSSTISSVPASISSDKSWPCYEIDSSTSESSDEDLFNKLPIKRRRGRPRGSTKAKSRPIVIETDSEADDDEICILVSGSSVTNRNRSNTRYSLRRNPASNRSFSSPIKRY